MVTQPQFYPAKVPQTKMNTLPSMPPGTQVQANQCLDFSAFLIGPGMVMWLNPAIDNAGRSNLVTWMRKLLLQLPLAINWQSTWSVAGPREEWKNGTKALLST